MAVERKTKIGQKVKGIPSAWVKAQKVYEDDDAETVQYKELMNHTLLDRQPYFFKFRYPQAKKDFYAYEEQKQHACRALYNRTIKQLEETPRKTREQKQWLLDYYQYAPLIVSDSPMNMVCKYIESVDFGIMQEIKTDSSFDPTIYMGQAEIADEIYQEIVYYYQSYVREIQQLLTNTAEEERDHLRKTAAEVLRERLRCVCFDSRTVMAALVKYLYIDNPHGKKTLLWEAYGKDMVEALSEARPRCLAVPMPSSGTGFDYLGKRYEMWEVVLDA